MGICYRPVNKEEVEETFFQTSKSQNLVLIGDFNYCDIYWESCTEIHRQSIKILEHLMDNFFGTQGGKTLFIVLLINQKELVKNVKVEGNLGGNECETIEFKILKKEKKESRRIRTL